MSNREKLPEFIDRYNNGLLSGEELQSFLEMIKKSPRLMEEIRLDKELNDVLADKDILELRKIIQSERKRKERKSKPGFRMLLMAATVLILVGTLILLTTEKPEHMPATGRGSQIVAERPLIKKERAPEIPDSKNIGAQTKQETPLRTRDTRLAASFRTNPVYESMIGATRHPGHFRMVSPLKGDHFPNNQNIRFKWIKDGSETITVEIIDTFGTIIKESEIPDDEIMELPAGSVHAGLYYYKLMMNEEVLYIGKFIID